MADEPRLIADNAESVAINVECEECGEAPAYTLICVDGTNMAVCEPCHIWLDHHSVPVLNDGSPHADNA